MYCGDNYPFFLFFFFFPINIQHLLVMKKLLKNCHHNQTIQPSKFKSNKFILGSKGVGCLCHPAQHARRRKA